MKKTIDLRGLICPEPVLRTKKLIDDTSVSSIEALVDSEVNVQNLSRLAGSQNLMVTKEKEADHFRVVIVRGEDSTLHTHMVPAAPSPSGISGGSSSATTGTIVLISRDTLGQGAGQSDNPSADHDFSANLLNLFLQTIKQSGHQPRAILMVNSGVKVIDPDGPYIKVLNDLRESGVEVLACGLCLDYYKLKDKVAIEQVTNMFAICEYLFSADRIISP